MSTDVDKKQNVLDKRIYCFKNVTVCRKDASNSRATLEQLREQMHLQGSINHDHCLGTDTGKQIEFLTVVGIR